MSISPVSITPANAAAIWPVTSTPVMPKE